MNKIKHLLQLLVYRVGGIIVGVSTTLLTVGILGILCKLITTAFKFGYNLI